MNTDKLFRSLNPTTRVKVSSPLWPILIEVDQLGVVEVRDKRLADGPEPRTV